MTKPTPEPVDPAELVALAQAVMNSARFPFLATVDPEGAPHLRPVSPVRTVGFTVFVANLRFYGKTGEISANPRVELGYMDAKHDQVRIAGVAEVVTDREILESIWEENPLLRSYLGSLDNPMLIIYRVRPTRVRYMKEWATEYHEVLFQP